MIALIVLTNNESIIASLKYAGFSRFFVRMIDDSIKSRLLFAPPARLSGYFPLSS
jgi:hypothetical protein